MSLLHAQDIPGNEDLNTSQGNIFENFREGKSSLITDENRDEIAKLYVGTKSLNILKNIVSDKNINRCATKIVSAIKNNLNLKNDGDVRLAILGLRFADSLDDISAAILIKASGLSSPLRQPFTRSKLSDVEEENALLIFKSQIKDLKNSSLCIEDSYSALAIRLASASPKYIKNLKYLNKLALDHNIINENNYRTLETMRSGKVHEWPLTLLSYGQSLDYFSKKFPNRTKQSSETITDKTAGKFRHKISLRQALYNKYNSTQIILLANMAKQLKQRLEAKNIAIVINYSDDQTEVIDLNPMEKFRFILKVLRKELATLNNSSLLNGNPANYLDIITASYEVGYIGANEIEQLASLEDIWNPKKTPREKFIKWTERFGGMASVLLPPPFGFVSLMSIMLFEQYSSTAPINNDTDINIF